MAGRVVRMRRRPSVAVGIAVFVGCLVTLPADAQRFSFNPGLSVSSYYTDDVDYAGEDDRSDTLYRLALELPLTTEFRNGSFDLRLTPFIERYERSRVYDHEGYLGRVSLRFDPSRHSTLEIGARGFRSQDQGVFELDDPDLFLTPRAERKLLSPRVSFVRRVGERWSWDLMASWADWEFEALSGVTPGSPPPPLEDRTDLTFGAGIRRQLSARSSLGVQARRHDYDLEFGGQETVNMASLVVNRQLGRLWSLQLAAGGFHRSGTASDGSDLSDTRPQGSVALNRDLRGQELQLSAASLPSSGGALLGTAEVRRVQIALVDTAPGRWIWSLFGRFARRLPSLESLPDSDLAQAGGALEFRLRPTFGLRFDGHYADQSGGAEFERSYYRLGFSLVSYPFAHTAMAVGVERGPRADG